jgi:hypothetical protein
MVFAVAAVSTSRPVPVETGTARRSANLAHKAGPRDAEHADRPHMPLRNDRRKENDPSQPAGFPGRAAAGLTSPGHPPKIVLVPSGR